MSVNLGGSINKRLAAYLSAAGAVGTVMASKAEAVVVGTTNQQAFGINGVVDIDFNNDGQLDFQIDHDRVDLGSGNIYDYLQIDKADINSELMPLPFDTQQTNPPFQAQTFPAGATTPNDANQSAYVITGAQGSYPAALTQGTLIGQASTFDFQENDSFQFSSKWIRANRLIDEDMTLIDQNLGGEPASGIQPALGTPGWAGTNGAVRYLGLKMDLNNANTTDNPGLYNYGWVGVQITDDLSGTGVVTGWAYETTPGLAIRAGVIPEPAGIVTALVGGWMAACVLWRRWIRR
jgi:hypothetical protein